MIRVTVELWFWFGNELAGDFESPSEMRSKREEVVEEGTRIRALLHDLATRYQPIGQKIFDLNEEKLREDVVMTYNDEFVSTYTILEQVLRDGDRMTIFPVYTGG